MSVEDQRQIRIVVGELERFSSKAIVALVLDITANLIESTPVDTGWARANWVPASGAAIFGLATPSARDSRKSAATTQGAKQQTALAAIVVGYKLKQGPVFIANGVPYIVRLNEGSSQKAPEGFVQAAIASGVAKLNAVGLLL